MNFPLAVLRAVRGPTIMALLQGDRGVRERDEVSERKRVRWFRFSVMMLVWCKSVVASDSGKEAVESTLAAYNSAQVKRIWTNIMLFLLKKIDQGFEKPPGMKRDGRSRMIVAFAARNFAGNVCLAVLGASDGCPCMLTTNFSPPILQSDRRWWFMEKCRRRFCVLRLPWKLYSSISLLRNIFESLDERTVKVNHVAFLWGFGSYFSLADGEIVPLTIEDARLVVNHRDTNGDVKIDPAGLIAA
ncbi:hypothetical protein E2542_SST28647 [Spatholobus suberectus]|nr:hypothetical protein E2542_SST28647 [Spatholobus suberectus]